MGYFRSGPVFDGMPLPIRRLPIPRRQLGSKTFGYVRISPDHFVPKKWVKPGWLAEHEARFHPRHFRYEASARLRTYAHLKEYPEAVAGAWSSLAMYGLPFFVDSADTTLYCSKNRRPPANIYEPYFFRHPLVTPWSAQINGSTCKLMPPLFSTVQAWRSLVDGQHSWYVPGEKGARTQLIREVQLLDAVRAYFGFSPTEIRSACKQRIKKQRVEKVLALSRDTADSPPETVARLIVHEFAHTRRVEAVEQYGIFDGERLVTRLDAAIPELRIGIFYDGEHHLDRAQRDRDSQIATELAIRGWDVLRVTAGTLKELASNLARPVDARP